ncbi:hypothetical protein N7E70_007185 [Aminobacter sp. NyZ550]|uniref:hypothetical protein n=1 Tax=Aminobacter sp. NyZ550 TaxID=2979870 RepID=UPI0021D5DF07|nr:hypothetical protein [Aminobacter sp. NyZ550]WAX96637.1 hypothetical protein N7E70_007185 [Aminobacter sp. NyZ550]
MPIVEFEGQRVEFPDDFSDDEIAEALSTLPAKSSVASPRRPNVIQVQAPDGTIVEFPDDTPEEVMTKAMRDTFGGPEAPAAATPAAPVPIGDARDATGVPGGVAEAPSPERSLIDTIMGSADYADDTAAIGVREGRRGAAQMLGLPVDLVNAGLGFAGVPISDQPFLGGDYLDELFGVPSTLAAVALDRPAELEPQDAFQRVVGRVGKEIGAAAVPVAGALGTAARVGKEGAREMGALGRMFVEPAAVAPRALVQKEAQFATGAGLGAGLANEAAGNDQNGDNFWSDFLGSLGGVGVTALGSRLTGAARNAVAAATGKPAMMDEVAGQEVADRIINNSTAAGEQFAKTGRVDTAPLAAQLRQPSQVEDVVPGYVANIGDRMQDPLLMTMVQNQDMLTPGAANMRRVGNEAAVSSKMDAVAPQGDPAQFRAALSSGRDAQIAEAQEAEDLARAIFGEAEQGVQPGMRDATARGSSLRSGVQDAYDAVRQYVSELWDPVNNATTQVDVGPLRDRFAAVDESLPVNDRTRFRPAEADVPGQLAPADTDGMVPLNEVTSIRGGLSDDLRGQRAAGQRNAARVTQQYQDEVDNFTEAAIPPELRDQYETARAARTDQGNRFERPGTAIAETLRPREGGGYRLDDSAVAGRFAQPDSGRINDTRALLREAGTDTRVRNALADEVLADVQSRGLLERPEALNRYMSERNILLGEFPELRDSLTRARAAGEYRTGVEQASAETQKRLNTPGRSAQASYLQFGDEATVDAVRNLTSGPKPREAARELIEAAGGTPEARQNARAALWEAVKTKKLPAQGATGGDRWDAKKLKAFFDDPKTAAVADELWSDNPEDLASIKDFFNALAGAEGSVRTRAPNSSGTAQALSGKFDPSLSPTSIAARARSVNRGQMSLSIAVVDVAAMWLRGRSAKVQARAIDTMASAAFNNPGMAADLLEKFNPADLAAKRRRILQKYGVRATQVLNLLDEIQSEDPVLDAVQGDGEPQAATSGLSTQDIAGIFDHGTVGNGKRPAAQTSPARP